MSSIPFTWEKLAANVALLRHVKLVNGLPVGLVADGQGNLYAKGSRTGRYYSFINGLILVSTSRLSWAVEKSCSAIESIPGLLLQLIHFHRIVSPALLLDLPIAPDGFATYEGFIRWLIEVQNWPATEVETIRLPAFLVALQSIRHQDVVDHAQKVLEIVNESRQALREGLDVAVAIPKSPVDQLHEEVLSKDAIIDTLQGEVESVQRQNAELKTLVAKLQPQDATAQAPLAAPATPPAFVLEEEKAMMTAAVAQELKKMERLLNQMEGKTGENAAHPPPLALARDIGLATTGRVPRPSDEENLDLLKQLVERLARLHEKWEAMLGRGEEKEGEGEE